VLSLALPAGYVAGRSRGGEGHGRTEPALEVEHRTVFLVDQLLLVGGVLLLIGIVSSKFARHLGLPVLVLFLGVGMLAGEEGLGRIAFENYALAHGIGTVALGIILFDGGLRTPFGAFRVAWKPSALLATVGVLITSVVTGVAAAWILGIPLLHGILLGSIVGSTDAAAVSA
jgi:potassium/hydrogen antiporter